MLSAGLSLLALALPFSILASSTPAFAQSHGSEPASPVIHSFVLRHAGQIRVDPFGSSGRREVLQLMQGRDPYRGAFRRARLHRSGAGEWVEEGWYEIRGDLIRFYHHDGSGSATGRVEVGRYLEKIICLDDPDNGEPLAFELLAPEPARKLHVDAGENAPGTRTERGAGAEDDGDASGRGEVSNDGGKGVSPGTESDQSSVNACAPQETRAA